MVAKSADLDVVLGRGAAGDIAHLLGVRGELVGGQKMNDVILSISRLYVYYGYPVCLLILGRLAFEGKR